VRNTFTAKIERFETPGAWYYVSVPIELSEMLKYFLFHGRQLKKRF